MESMTPTRCFWNPALCVHRESLLLIGCIFFFSPLYQAELQEVVGEEEAEDVSSTSSAPAESSKGETPESPAAQVQYTSAKLETDTINMFVKWEIFFACCQ